MEIKKKKTQLSDTEKVILNLIREALDGLPGDNGWPRMEEPFFTTRYALKNVEGVIVDGGYRGGPGPTGVSGREYPEFLKKEIVRLQNILYVWEEFSDEAQGKVDWFNARIKEVKKELAGNKVSARGKDRPLPR